MSGPFNVSVIDWDNNEKKYRVRFETERQDEMYKTFALSKDADTYDGNGDRIINLTATAGAVKQVIWTQQGGAQIHVAVRQADIIEVAHDPAIGPKVVEVKVTFNGATQTSDVIRQQAPDGLRNMFSWPNVLRTWIDRVI